MKRLTPSLIAVAILAGVVAVTARTPRQAAAQQSTPTFVTEIPSGYRDWRLISVAHEEGDLHSFAAVLGNDVAIQAYREGKSSFPDGTIIASLHYRHVPSEENNRVFGRDQSFIAGAPTNIQFMVKGSKKYAATGG
jgi:Cytochrome P460